MGYKEKQNNNTATESEGHQKTRVSSPSRNSEATEYRMADPPDGGWGWVVVLSSFMIHVIVDGVTYTFGIFYMEFLRHFKESKGATSWVASIMVGTTFCIGPVASGLTNKFGCRAVTVVGSLLATFGLLTSTVAPSILCLYFTAGLCTGAGFGLMYLPAIVCVTCYFEKKRAFATGIAVCGSGIGTFAMAPIIEWMVAELGWQGAMLVVAGLVLNCCVFGALFRPLPAVPVSRRPTLCSLTSDGLTNGYSNGIRKGSLPNGTIDVDGEVRFAHLKKDSIQLYSKSALAIDQQFNPSHRGSTTDPVRMARSMTLHAETLRSSGSHTSIGPLSRKDVFYSGSLVNITDHRNRSASKLPGSYQPSPSYPSPPTEKDYDEKDGGIRQTIYRFLCPQEMREAFVQMMDFRLMADVVFLMFGFSNFFTNIGFNVPFVYTKDRAFGMGIADEDYASYLLSVIGIANTVGRIILGYLSDIKCINRLWLYNASLTVCGLSTILSTVCNTYTLMSLYAIAFGATAGAYVSLTSVILVDLLGLDKLTNAFGLLLVFEGIACLIGPPITGWLYDYTGSYDPGFSVSGAMIAVSGLMLFFIPCVQRLLQRRERRSAAESQSSDVIANASDNKVTAQV